MGPREKLQMLCAAEGFIGGCYDLREMRDTSGETLERQAKQGSSSIMR